MTLSGTRTFVLVLLLSPLFARAEGRISTYLEGTLVHKTTREWVLVTEDGTYWINVERPPSWKRKMTNGQVSFWVQTQQIHRFRPQANPAHLFEHGNDDTAVAQQTKPARRQKPPHAS